MRRRLTPRRATVPAERRRWKPRIEAMERRQLLANVFTVTNGGDDGQAGTLRQAILDANATPNVPGEADQIIFNINPPAGGPVSIPVQASPMPTITEAVIIDGRTQPGYAGVPLIQLDGTLLGAGDGLTIAAPDTQILALAITRMPGSGIVINGPGSDLVAGCYIGIDPTGGLTPAGNDGDGIDILSSSNNTIGGLSSAERNVVSGNTLAGLFSGGGTNNLIVGNYFGLAPDGTTAQGNGGTGIFLSGGSGNTVGGAAGGAGNVISANGDDGIDLGSGESLAVIAGNFIGTTAAGDADRGNAGDGVAILGSPNNTVGGATAGARNVITGNVGHGVSITVSGANGNLVAGNLIGLGLSGTSAGNTASGIDIAGVANNTIGGVASSPGLAPGNVVSNNQGDGITIRADAAGVAASNNVVVGNAIGASVDLQTFAGNDGFGIFLDEASGTRIGGPGGAGNRIVANAFSGINLAIAQNTSIEGNVIGAATAAESGAGNTGGIVIRQGTNNTVGGLSADLGNTVSGNRLEGILVELLGTSGNQIVGNRIGVGLDGVTPLGNEGAGITFVDGGSMNTVGGLVPGAGNIIANNGGAGVAVEAGGFDSVMNSILSNSIYNNAGLGIELGPGANQDQAAPVLSDGRIAADGVTTFQGTVTGPLLGTLTIQVFRDFATPPGGQGRELLSTFQVQAGSFGEAQFTVTLSAVLRVGEVVTATATDAAGNTSQFSKGAVPRIAVIGSAGPLTEITVGGDGTFQVEREGFRSGQVYPPTSAPGDAGIFVRQDDGMVFGLDPALHPSTATGNTNTKGFRTLSMARSADGLSVTAVMDNFVERNPPVNPFQVTQVTSYSPGTEFFTVANTLVNRGDTPLTISFFAAADLYLADSDFGIGLFNSATGAVGARSLIGDAVIFIQPNGGLSPSAYQEAYFDTIWAIIGDPTRDFNNTIDPNLVDDGAGLEWRSVTLAPRDSALFAYLWSFQRREVSFQVTNTNDSGEGSLRQAIINTNAVPGQQTITFNIPTPADCYIIQPLSALPAITDSVIIDATTQPGFGGRPIVELAGAQAGSSADGLLFQVGTSTVRGLAIHDFAGAGIRFTNGGGNVLETDYLGLNCAGTEAPGNRGGGAVFVNSPSNTVGGTAASQRVVVSGNDGPGGLAFMQGSGRSLVLNTFVGTDAAGTRALRNGVGILVDGVSDTSIGGGSGLGAAANVISGNVIGIQVQNGATGTVVAGNYIGTDARGLAAVANTEDGVAIINAPGNRVGAAGAVPANLISGNRFSGVRISGSSSTGNRVVNNWIGLAATGDRALGNRLDGVFLDSAPGNTVGGTSDSERNVISASGEANVQAAGAGAAGNAVVGNYVGTGAGGNRVVVPADGVQTLVGIFVNNAPGNTVSRNVVAGHQVGIELFQPGAAGNVVQSNRVGTDRTGAVARSNDTGVFVFNAPGNLIGGAGGGNLISGNDTFGVRITGDPAVGNRVESNLIGTDAAGTGRLGNGFDGVFLQATGNAIGGTATGAGNVISGNGSVGVQLFGAGGNVLSGNLIGTDLTGGAPLGNRLDGVFINDSASNTLSGNVVSANGSVGVQIFGPNAAGNLLTNNRIGTDANGAVVRGLGNNFGLFLNTRASNTIAGDNTIAGNTRADTVLGNQLQAPGVTAVEPVTDGLRIAALRVSYSKEMDPASAQSLRNYRLQRVGAARSAGGRRVPLASATYDPATQSVTLIPAVAIGTEGTYRLTIVGTRPRGVRDTQGQFLAGGRNGRSGTNFVTVFGRGGVRAARGRPAVPAGARALFAARHKR